MGLDLYTRNRESRLNWSGVQSFRDWSLRELEVDPFPSWDGGNGTTVIFGRKVKNSREVKGDIKDIEKWIEAFTKYQILGSDSIDDDWEYHFALEWYWFLICAMRGGYINYF